MEPDARALLHGSDDDGNEGGSNEEERRRGGAGTSAMAENPRRQATTDSQVVSKKKGSKFQGRGSKKVEFMIAVSHLIEAESVREMDKLIEELEDDWADYYDEKTYKDEMAKVRVAREKMEQVERAKKPGRRS